jgi:hypothetical protein
MADFVFVETLVHTTDSVGKLPTGVSMESFYLHVTYSYKSAIVIFILPATK